MMARSNSSARPGAPVETPLSGATAADFGSFLGEPCFIEQARAFCSARAQITQTRICQQGQTGRAYLVDLVATFVSNTAAPAFATSSSWAALFAPLTPIAPITWPS